MSGSRNQLQDISIPVDYLDCAGTTFDPDAPIVLDAVAVAADGSFSSTQTQTGVVGSDNYPTTFTVTFQGHFHGVNADGDARAAGSVLETAKYTDGTTFSCTSNKQSWSVARGTQPTQTTALPPTGSYTGNFSGNGYGITLYVSGSRNQLQDISIPVDYLDCAGTTFDPDAPIVLDAVTLASNGSFSSTSTQTGVVGSDNYPTTFTITFQGHFHGVNAGGAERAAGSVIETAKYTNGTTYNCTSNKQSWSVAWRSQPTQPTGHPPAGSYSGTTRERLWHHAERRHGPEPAPGRLHPGRLPRLHSGYRVNRHPRRARHSGPGFERVVLLDLDPDRDRGQQLSHLHHHLPGALPRGERRRRGAGGRLRPRDGDLHRRDHLQLHLEQAVMVGGGTGP